MIHLSFSNWLEIFNSSNSNNWVGNIINIFIIIIIIIMENTIIDVNDVNMQQVLLKISKLENKYLEIKKEMKDIK